MKETSLAIVVLVIFMVFGLAVMWTWIYANSPEPAPDEPCRCFGHDTCPCFVGEHRINPPTAPEPSLDCKRIIYWASGIQWCEITQIYANATDPVTIGNCVTKIHDGKMILECEITT